MPRTPNPSKVYFLGRQLQRFHAAHPNPPVQIFGASTLALLRYYSSLAYTIRGEEPFPPSWEDPLDLLRALIRWTVRLYMLHGDVTHGIAARDFGSNLHSAVDGLRDLGLLERDGDVWGFLSGLVLQAVDQFDADNAEQEVEEDEDVVGFADDPSSRKGPPCETPAEYIIHRPSTLQQTPQSPPMAAMTQNYQAMPVPQLDSSALSRPAGESAEPQRRHRFGISHRLEQAWLRANAEQLRIEMRRRRMERMMEQRGREEAEAIERERRAREEWLARDAERSVEEIRENIERLRRESDDE